MASFKIDNVKYDLYFNLCFIIREDGKLFDFSKNPKMTIKDAVSFLRTYKKREENSFNYF